MRFISNTNKDLSLVEQKRLQWAKEKDEMERIGELFSATTTRKIEKTSIRTYYSNVDLSHKFNSQKLPYYDGNGSLIVDDILDDNNNNGKRYYQNKQDNLYIPYGNERIRSPSLPPIGRQKYGTKPRNISTSADEDTSGYLSDNNNNNTQEEPSMNSPDIWIKNQPSSTVYNNNNESDQERNSRPRLRLPNESLNDHHHRHHQHRNHQHHHHLQTQQYYNKLSSTGSSSTTSSSIKFQEKQQQQQHQQKQHQQQLNENYNILMNNKREKSFYENIDHKSRKNQRNETTSRLTYLTSTAGNRKIHNLLDDNDQDEFQISKSHDSHGTPSSSSSSDTSRDFSLASSYQESLSVRKSKEERAKWGDRGVMVGHFYDPLLKDQSNQNKTGPVWLERGLHDVRDSGDESAGSYSYIRGQNAPIDPNDLAERATRRLKALEFQNAIKQQLEERELERKRDLEHRKLEELKYEERIQRQAEIERERLEYEKLKQQDKLDQEKRKQEIMRLALEKASIDAKLEKEKRLREKGLMPPQAQSSSISDDIDEDNDDVDEKIFVEKTGSNRIDIRMDGCDGSSIDLTQFQQQKPNIIRDNNNNNNNHDEEQSKTQNDLIKTTIRENLSTTNNNDERFLIGTPIKLRQKNIDDVIKIPNEKIKTKRSINRIEHKDKFKQQQQQQQLIDDTGGIDHNIINNNYDNDNDNKINDNNHKKNNNENTNNIINNDIEGIALVLQAIPPALVQPTLQQYSNDLLNLNSNLNSIQFAIMLAQQMQYNQQTMNSAFNNFGVFDTKNLTSLRPPATAPPQLEKMPDAQQMKLQLSNNNNNNNNLSFIDIPIKNNNEIISPSVYNDETISDNNRDEIKNICNVCGKQQKLDSIKLKENLCEKVTISTSTTIDGIIIEESQQSNDKLYSLPHDATFTKESTNNLMIETNNNNNHSNDHNNNNNNNTDNNNNHSNDNNNNTNNNNKGIIKLNASTQTEFDCSNIENTECFDSSSLDDKSVMYQDDQQQQQQEYHYHHYHHHHVYLNEMANNNNQLPSNNSLKELTRGTGNQSLHDDTITDVNPTDDNNNNNKQITHRTLATNTSSLPRNLSKLTNQMGKKFEERPKWGVNRPSMQYVKASERDPFYMKKQQRKKLSKYYSLGDSGIDSGDIDIVSGTEESSQIIITDQMQLSPSKSHVSSASLLSSSSSSSSSTSSVLPTVPNASINNNNNNNQTFRNDETTTMNTIIQTQHLNNNNNNKLARNICTEILPIKTDLNGRIYLNFREASIIVDEDEIKNTIKRRLYKKMDRIMNRRKTANEIFQNVNDNERQILTSKCENLKGNMNCNENGDGVVVVVATGEGDAADADEDEDEEKLIACKTVIKKRNNPSKTKVIHTDIDLDLC